MAVGIYIITPRWDVYAAARYRSMTRHLQNAGVQGLGALWKYNEDFSPRRNGQSQHLLNLGVPTNNHLSPRGFDCFIFMTKNKTQP